MELSKRRIYETGDMFTISTKRYELKHGKLPKDNERKEWQFRIHDNIYSFSNRYSKALELAKDIAEHKEYYFIELVP